MRRINFIQGLSNIIDNPCTVECSMFRYGLCTDNDYSHCYDYDYFLSHEKEIRKIEYDHCMKNIKPLVKCRPLIITTQGIA